MNELDKKMEYPNGEHVLEQEEFDLDELVRQCLYRAASMLTEGVNKADRKVERVRKLQELLLPTKNQGINYTWSINIPNYKRVNCLSCEVHLNVKKL